MDAQTIIGMATSAWVWLLWRAVRRQDAADELGWALRNGYAWEA
jgi:hypothetical protein